MGGVFSESDMDSLAQLAEANGVPLKVLSAARDVNHTLAERLVDKIALALNSVENKDVGILGLAFKPVSYTHLDVYKRQALMAAKGDVQFRRAEMSDAEVSYLTAKKLDAKEVRAYLGLAKLYRSYSLYRKAYDPVSYTHLDVYKRQPSGRAS